MRIVELQKSNRVYSCNSYLILGDWNRVGDVNTLIDPGADDYVVEQIERISTGLGKVAVDQILLTHNHFDHAAGMAAVKERYKARVCAFAPGAEVDEVLGDGRLVAAGDHMLEVIHLPGHSSDSVCFYAPSSKVLFAGDSHMGNATVGDLHTEQYASGLARLASREIETIYSGHDAPMTQGCRSAILSMVGAARVFGRRETGMGYSGVQQWGG